MKNNKFNSTVPKIIKDRRWNEIAYLQADSNYTNVIFANGQKEVSGYHLKFFSQILDTAIFLRIDRSNLVHRSFIAEVIHLNSEVHVLLKDQKEIKIPRRKIPFLKSIL